MAKTPLPQIPAKLYELLAPLTPEDRVRAVQATLVLFGDEVSEIMPPGQGSGLTGKPRKPGATPSDPSEFVREKDPQNKGELLAVAARYRELVGDHESHPKADLQKVITDARRNFDDRNFARDLNNAKRQAGFFLLGTGQRDSAKLSHYGKEYVDALPDRDATAKLRRPKVGGAKGGTPKKPRTTKKKTN